MNQLFFHTNKQQLRQYRSAFERTSLAILNLFYMVGRGDFCFSLRFEDIVEEVVGHKTTMLV